MPIVPERKNIVTVAKGFTSALQSRTAINYIGPDSKSRAIVDTFTDKLLSQHNESISAHIAGSIPTAVGGQLDIIGQDLGIPRYSAAFAKVTTSEQSFSFYVNSGTFGGINGGADIPIPAGSPVFSAPDENELGSTITFVTTSAVTLRAASSSAYVAVIAKASGTRSNIGPAVIKSHSFTGYTDSGNDTLKVINFFNVLNGRNEELDAQYKYRLGRHYDRLISSNATKTQLTAIAVPGVIDTRVIAGLYGIGTVGVVVLGSDYQVNQNLLRSVQERLDSIYGPGQNAIASAAVSTKFDLSLRVPDGTGLNTAQARQFELGVRRGVDNYFRGLRIGGVVNLLELSNSIRIAGGTSVSLRRDSLEIFKNVYVRKGFASSSSSDRVKVIGKIYPLDEIEFAERGTLSFEYA
jgi:uncharacterized phage protein gp47/JayE